VVQRSNVGLRALRTFCRNSRDLRLTEVGCSLLEEAGPLIDQLDTVLARYKRGSRPRSVRISVQPFFASEYFVPRLSEFTAAHPELEVRDDCIVSEFPLIIHETCPMAWKQWSKSACIALPGNSKATRLDSMIAVSQSCNSRGVAAGCV
jgi:hypothetical protein